MIANAAARVRAIRCGERDRRKRRSVKKYSSRRRSQPPLGLAKNQQVEKYKNRNCHMVANKPYGCEHPTEPAGQTQSSGHNEAPGQSLLVESRVENLHGCVLLRVCSVPDLLRNERRDQYESSKCCHCRQPRSLGAQVSDREQQVNEIARYKAHQNAFQHQIEAHPWNQPFPDRMITPVVTGGVDIVFSFYTHDRAPTAARVHSAAVLVVALRPGAACVTASVVSSSSLALMRRVFRCMLSI